MRKFAVLFIVLFCSLSIVQAQNLWDGLVASFPFNGKITDGSGGNSTAYAISLTADCKGKINSAVSFNGSNSSIDLGINRAINSILNDFTISYWINKSNTNNGCVVASYSSQNDSYWRFISGIRNNVAFLDFVVGGGEGSWQGVSGGTINPNNWYHIVFTRNKNLLALYVNGILQASNTVSSEVMNNPTIPAATTRFGYNFPSSDNEEFFAGELDEIGFYDRALSSKEIQRLYVYEEPKITTYDYWFDDNDQQKISTPVSSSTSDFRLETEIATKALPTGLHSIQIRFKDTENAWSSTTSQFFVKMPTEATGLPKIVKYEYWFDNDDAKKEAQAVSSTSDLSLATNVAAKLLPAGLHTFQIRFQDERGAWSSTTSQFFVKKPTEVAGLPKIVKYEYWFDNEDAKKEAQAVTSTSDLSLATDVAAKLLPAGLHTFQIRFQDERGAWSSTTSQFFVKKPTETTGLPKIVKYEYWFDNEDAKKEAQAVTSTSDLSLVTNVAAKLLPAGLHTFQIRFQDERGAWSSTISQFFVKQAVQSSSMGNKITTYRYWVDKDLEKLVAKVVDPVNPLVLTNQNVLVKKVQKATPDDYDFSPDPSKGLKITYKMPALFNMQFKDLLGNWSSPSSDTVRCRYTVDVHCDTLISRMPITKLMPQADTIHFYMVNALEGDSLSFQTNQPLTIDLFDTFGKKLKTIANDKSITGDGIRAQLDGAYFALVHGFGAGSGDYTITYLHIAKYAVLTYTPKKVGNSGTSLLEFEGNGFTTATKVSLVMKGTTTLIPVSTQCSNLSLYKASFDFSKAEIGMYDIEVAFDDSTIVIPNGLEVEGNVPINLNVSVLGPSVFRSGSPVTYTIQVENKGNTTAFNVPLTIRIKCNAPNDVPVLKILSKVHRLNAKDFSSVTEDKELLALLEKYFSNDKGMFIPDYQDGICYLVGDFLIPSISPNTIENFIFTVDKCVNEINISASVPKEWMLNSTTASSPLLKSGETCCAYEAVNCLVTIISEVIGLPGNPNCILSNLRGYGYTQIFCNGSDLSKLFEDPLTLTTDVFWAAITCALQSSSKEKVKDLLEKTPWGWIIKGVNIVVGCRDFIKDSWGNKCGSGDNNGELKSSPIRSYDPNDKIGYRSPSGSTYFSADRKNFTYVINFENKALATAPAQEIYITDPLDLNSFDINSFKAGYVKVGNKIVQAPFDAQEHTWKIDMRPEMNLMTEVQLTLDKITGNAKWYLKAIDPMTGTLPTDPFVGFLPPNDSDGSGQGSVSFSIDLKNNLADDASVENKASIVFDYNEAILTPTWSNKKDVVAPTSSMFDAVFVNDSIATLRWQGTDNTGGSGVYGYNLFQKKGTENFGTLLSTSSLKTIDIDLDANVDYSFYVTAVDSAGNIEIKEPLAEVTIKYSPETVIQKINLNSGWNIISANIKPSNTDLKGIFRNLIDAGKLKKVMDESGKTLENFGAFGGWKNSIGNWQPTEGYKVNVPAATVLILEGQPIPLPFEIPLSTGWNIISYPATSFQDVKAAFQSLIDTGKLKKVMDESGKTLENFGAFGGWKNSIGSLTEGKGYKVNVTGSCTLTISEGGTKAATIVPEVLASTHFKPAYMGNGTDHMSINLVDLSVSGIELGDELGVFDGSLCVGSAKVGVDQLTGDYLSMPVSASDGLTSVPNGFTEGHLLTVRYYREGKEYTPSLELLNDSKQLFAKGESIFLRMKSGQTTGVDSLTQSEKISVKCYPNPFSEQVTIEIELPKPQHLEVNIYDVSGRLIKALYSGISGETQKLTWDGRNDAGTKMVFGTYMIRTNGNVNKVILK